MKRSKTASIEVKIGAFNRETETVTLPTGSSVQDALDQASISLGSAESVWVEGVKADPSDTVENGDLLQIVGKKEGGIGPNDNDDEPADEDTAPEEKVEDKE